MSVQVLTAEEAVAVIPNGATLCVSGTGPVLEPDLVLEALEKRFLSTGEPRGLTLVTPMLPGDRPGVGGMNCFAHAGMLARIIGASFAKARHPRLLDLLRSGDVEAYMVAMGSMVELLTAIGSGKPGVFTTVGLGTALDPRNGGGALNDRSTKPPVRVETIDGREYLFYPAFPITHAIIRGTTADENGYLSFEEETNTLGAAEIAMACKASGGTVIAQVKRLARGGSLDPRLVRVPGPLVDVVVVHPRQTQLSPAMADPLAGWNPFLAGALKHPLKGLATVEKGSDRVILRRAALALEPGDVVNLGAGVATRLPLVALAEGILDKVTFTNEHGIFGGLMATALGGSFVPALNADAIMDSAFQFNFYDGGGLDITFLGIGEVDAKGDLNVSRFGEEINGPGGFNNITDRTKRIVFCGTLTSGGLKVEIDSGRVRIAKEGRFRKFVPKVEHVTFNAARAFEKGQSVLYVTERGVMRLTRDGPELVEIAPGVDLDRDIRAQVGFELKVATDLRAMPTDIFKDEPMRLAERFEGNKVMTLVTAPEQVVLGHWFEDFVIGREMLSPGRTIAESDLTGFAGLTGDYSQVHTDEEFCKKTEFGTRIAHGLFGLAVAQGLMWRTNYTQGTGVASLGWDKYMFKKPIKIGDTVRARWRVTEKRDSKSKPNMGIIVEFVELVNQRGEVTQQGEHILMVRRRPA